MALLTKSCGTLEQLAVSQTQHTGVVHYNVIKYMSAIWHLQLTRQWNAFKSNEWVCINPTRASGCGTNWAVSPHLEMLLVCTKYNKTHCKWSTVLQLL